MPLDQILLIGDSKMPSKENQLTWLRMGVGYLAHLSMEESHQKALKKLLRKGQEWQPLDYVSQHDTYKKPQDRPVYRLLGQDVALKDHEMGKSYSPGSSSGPRSKPSRRSSSEFRGWSTSTTTPAPRLLSSGCKPRLSRSARPRNTSGSRCASTPSGPRTRSGGPFMLGPVFLKTPKRIASLVFLIMAAAMVACLIERQIRRVVEQRQAPIRGLMPKNRDNLRPTVERIFKVFATYSVVIARTEGKLVGVDFATLNPVQRQILQALSLPEPAQVFARSGP